MFVSSHRGFSSVCTHRKAVYISICSTSKSRLVAMCNTTQMVDILTTGLKISSKSIPFLWLNPLITNLALYHGFDLCSSCFTLYTHLFIAALLLLGNFANLNIVIQSCLAWHQSTTSCVHFPPLLYKI